MTTLDSRRDDLGFPCQHAPFLRPSPFSRYPYSSIPTKLKGENHAMADYHKRVVTAIEDRHRTEITLSVRYATTGTPVFRTPRSSCLPNLHDPGPAICGMPCLT